ncbi:Crp/Fnr family transcriptional regulator [Algoriphagus terrigena]|uniref:Crp/Fnr family transcriptional regulator n=1 Tax=Algoriphagus terrigena TaxID=344884 RepID=UPI000424F8B7|nr:Crp/Fnr family transcriptional regulator [Algoriphagus terrigena]
MDSLLSLMASLELHGTKKTYKPGENFVKKDQIPQKIAIVKKGLFRYYYLTGEGKEFTKVFMPEGSILSAYSAMVSGTRSHFFIEAIEEATTVEITFDTWKKLRAQDPKWDRLLIAFLEKGYAVKEKREREFLFLDAEARYRQFLIDYPELEARVTQRIIASYLGVTPIALSRIRRKMGLINLC